MPLFPVQQAPQKPDEKDEPLYQRIQDWIFKADVGIGLHLFRVMLFAILALFIAMLYTGTQFYGLRDAEAMDMGQLGRNLARYGSYVTQTIRPMELGYLAAVGQAPLRGPPPAQPELWTPPVYPWILSVVFRTAAPDISLSAGMLTLGGDRIVMMVSWGFFMVDLALLYILARLLFDHRVGTLALYLFLFCDALLDFAVSGLCMTFLMMLVLIMAIGLVLAQRWQAARQSPRRVNAALAACAFAVAIGTLTRYSFAALLLPLLLYVVLVFPQARWQRFGLCLGIFLVVMLPWVSRNRQVSKTWFGLTKYSMYEGTEIDATHEIKPGQLQRTLMVDARKLLPGMLVRKSMLNGRKLYEQTLGSVGSNYLIAFFLVALLHQFRNPEVFRLRRWIFWSLVALMLWLSVSGLEKRNQLTVFMPLVALYSAAFFYVLFERMQFRKRIARRGMITLFVCLNALPFFYSIFGPRSTSPYPPYNGGVGIALQKYFHESELLASDIPWAVAWYANRSAVWVPLEESDYMVINDRIRFISGVYMTQATLQEMDILELLAGKQRFLMRLFQPPAPEFPLRFIGAATPDRQQVIVSTRPL